MFRIIQGDVGSGKTIVSLLSMVNVIESGYQCAFMAPTEILAKQHFELAKRFFDKTSSFKNRIFNRKYSLEKRKEILKKLKMVK